MHSQSGPTSTGPIVATGNRRLDIQGLRAIAVLMVVAFHAGLPIPGGFVGVDVFFVISGFVITGMLSREWANTHRIRFGQFYLRRFKRLTPALALMVAVTIVISAAVLSPLGTQQTASKTAIGAMLLVANFVIAVATGGYFDAPAQTNPLLNTWSLSVEEQFYLVFPALLALAWLSARRRRLLKATPPLVVGAVAVASFGLALLTSHGWTLPNSPWLLGFYSPFSRAWEFAAGALLALAATKLKITSGKLALALGLVGTAILGASLWLINDSTPFPGVSTLLPVAGTLLVILAGAKSNAVTGILATRPMVKVGDWSYSIYLWHWPLIVFAGILWPGRPRILLATALLSVGPALASYRWVEQPIRKVRNLSRPRLARIVVVTLAGPLIVSALLWVAASNGLWSQQIREYQAATMPTHVGFNAGCHTSVPISQRSMADCSWNQSATGRPVYLVGDSNADHFGEAVIGAGERLNRPVQIVTVNSCPFLDVYISMVPSSSSVFESCRSFYEDTLSWLEEQPPGLVIISFSDEAFRAADKAIGLTPDAESFDPSEKARSLSLGLRVTVTALQQSGHRVLLVQTVPHFVNPLYQPLRCPIPTLISGICGQDMPVEYTAQRQQDTRRAMQQVADETGATVLDLQGYLCPGGICSTRNSNLVLYRDDGHISVPASQSLAPQFAEAIKDAG